MANISDETIGANIQRFRGSISQKEMAARMRDAGWKWSQATVWSVEKGERPLRLAEAVDLGDILQVPFVALLLSDRGNAVDRAMNDFVDAGHELGSTIKKFYVTQAALARAVEIARENGEDLGYI